MGHEDLIRTLQNLVYHYDEPFGDAAGLPIYLLSQFAREHVKVVLAGDGADELFGGYRRYAYDQLAPYYSRLPRVVTETWIPGMLDRLPRLRRIKRTLNTWPLKDPARRYAAWPLLFTPEMQNELLCQGLADEISGHDTQAPYSRYYQALNPLTAADHTNRLMYTDLKMLLPDGYLEKVDKAAMACSLETRLPFLDHRLVEFSWHVPLAWKVRQGKGKWLLRKLLHQYIPPALIERPKMGFGVPIDVWLRGPLREWAESLLDEKRLKDDGFFDPQQIRTKWEEHQQGTGRWEFYLWDILMFQGWLEHQRRPLECRQLV